MPTPGLCNCTSSGGCAAGQACFGLLGSWKLGRLLGGPAAGFTALTLLVLTPVWYGHMFNNPKDMPFAVGDGVDPRWIGRSVVALTDYDAYAALNRQSLLRKPYVPYIAAGVVASLLIKVDPETLVDDDEAFLQVMGRALRRRGFDVLPAATASTRRARPWSI